MIQYSNYDEFFAEACRRVIHVSEHTSFSADINEEYRNAFDVLFEVKVIAQLFKDEDYSTLSNEYNDHELTERDLVGSRSFHLFYGTARDVVIVYKKHKNGHIVFHRIGNHEKVYDPDYQKMDKNRRIKRKNDIQVANIRDSKRHKYLKKGITKMNTSERQTYLSDIL